MLLNLISLEKKFIGFDYLKKNSLSDLSDNLCIMYLSVVSACITPYWILGTEKSI